MAGQGWKRLNPQASDGLGVRVFVELPGLHSNTLLPGILVTLRLAVGDSWTFPRDLRAPPCDPRLTFTNAHQLAWLTSERVIP